MPALSSARSRWVLGVLLVATLVIVLALDPARHLTLDNLKAEQAGLQAAARAQPLAASALCFAIYAVATALSIPGALVMTLAAGAVFGTLWGTVIVSFASTLGATGAFLIARHLLRGVVQARLGHRLAAINRGIAADGPAYLLTLRLIPLVPFIGVNLLMALTPIPTRTFYLYSQIGMLPATVVYVYAGAQLGRLDSLDDLLAPGVLGALAMLAVLPFATKLGARWIQRRRFALRFPRPAQVDRNVIVIGAGSAGLVAAYLARALRAKVTLIEQARMGGDCLHTGCVPSKALLAAARAAHAVRTAPAFGVHTAAPTIDFAAVMAHVKAAVDRIAPHDSIERYQALGIECIEGHARLISPYTVAVAGRELSARAIILATGARPTVPPLPGLDLVDYLTSDTLWDLTELPARLLVLGGGPVGCELAQAFARLGSDVTLVEMAPRLLPREDADAGALLAQVFAQEGITLYLHARAEAFVDDGDSVRLRCRSLAHDAGASFEIPCERVLLALGRTPCTEGYGLEALGVPPRTHGGLDVNAWLETRLPTVYACGDVAGPYQFTHAGAHQAWYATLNALFGNLWRRPFDARVLPWCTFTEPEVARVGLSEDEARAADTAYEVTTFDLAALDRAIADGRARGFVKVLTAPGSARILGALVVAPHAGEQLAELALAMRHHLGLDKILGTVHAYPTYADANKLAAGAWRRAHVAPWALRLLERYHARRRG